MEPAADSNVTPLACDVKCVKKVPMLSFCLINVKCKLLSISNMRKVSLEDKLWIQTLHSGWMNSDVAFWLNEFRRCILVEWIQTLHSGWMNSDVAFWLNVLILKMYEINTLLLLPLKIHLIILKHIKSLACVWKGMKFVVYFSIFFYIRGRHLGGNAADRREILQDGRVTFQTCLLTFSGDILRGLQMWEQKNVEGVGFWASKTAMWLQIWQCCQWT